MVSPVALETRYSMQTSLPVASALETWTSVPSLRLSRERSARLRAMAISCSVTLCPKATSAGRRTNSAREAFFMAKKSVAVGGRFAELQKETALRGPEGRVTTLQCHPDYVSERTRARWATTRAGNGGQKRKYSKYGLTRRRIGGANFYPLKRLEQRVL